MSIMRGDRDDQRSLVLDIFSGDGLQHIGVCFLLAQI